MKNKFLFLLFWGACLVNQARAELFKAEEFGLENGLKVVVIENHKAPIISQMVWYKGGAVDEIRGKGGVAHLLEHLMFRGTKKVKDNKFNDIMNELGAYSNAFTSYDFTSYYEMADISKLEALMELEADRMQNLNFSKEAFEAEQKIVYQERKQQIENNPSSVFEERFNLLLWGSRLRGNPIIGLDDEIKGLTYDDVMNFYRQFYAPNNALLILSGDIDVETAKILADKYYGKIKPRDVTHAEVSAYTDKFSENLEMEVVGIKMPKLIWKYLLKTPKELGNKIYDYEVLAEYLAGGASSALYRDLVSEQKKAMEVSASFNYVTRENSTFSIAMLPAEDVEPRQAKKILNKAIKKAISEFSPEKLEKVKHRLISGLVYIKDNPHDAANLAGYVLINGFGLDELQRYKERIEAVKFEDVKEAFTELFENSSKVQGLLLPNEGNTND